MRTIEEIEGIIAKGIGEKVKEIADGGQWIICTDRVFVNDYVPVYEEYLSGEPTDSADLMEKSPYEGPYDSDQRKWDETVFAVIKTSRGQMNQGFSFLNVTVTILTCNHEIGNPREVLMEYASEVNFEYQNGIIQAYFPPAVDKSIQEVYNGFRAIVSMSGTVKIPATEDVLFVTNIYYRSRESFIYESSMGTLYRLVNGAYVEAEIAEGTDISQLEYTVYKEDSMGYIDVLYKNQNFVTYAFGDNKSQDPQAFLDDSLYGITQNMNRQGTIALSFSTYLFAGEEFTSIIKESITDQNVFVKMAVRMSDGSIWYEGGMSVTGHSVNGEWGSISQFMVTATSGGYVNG